MKTVGVYEAKTHLPRLISEVRSGETFNITHHGVPVARLSPIEEPDDKGRSHIAEALAAWKKARKGLSLKGLSIRQLRDEGRR